MQYGVVLSELLREPGPTHSVADVLAAAVHELAPGPHVGLLGFEAGGLIAPLRALGAPHHVEAVDLTCRNVDLFHELTASWQGSVCVHRGDAWRWLRGQAGRFDMLIDDLSVLDECEVVKPPAVWETLPELMHAALRPGGVALFNLLEPQGLSWAAGLRRICRPFASARVVVLDEFENRLVVAADRLPTARALSRRLRRALHQLHSGLACAFHVRSLPG